MARSTSHKAHLVVARAREQELNDLRRVLASPEGRRVLWRMLSKAGIYQSTFDPMASTMCFNEGRRSLGLFLLAEIGSASEERLSQMMTEARARTEREEQALENAEKEE